MTKIKSFRSLPTSVTIKPSEIHGLGLFATEDIAKGVILGISHFEDEDTEDGVIRTPLGAFANHSYTPNANVIDDTKKWTLITVQDIKKGEEITVDYSPWYEADILKTYK